ncbi:hypothetical protein SAMN02745136_05730 [Anaerocolumna jejuensis DSM 15929]|uniref:Uncharacterized protein n=1 Tax=Anaerocolumna jejuensis DSM 15929 TaxID=1121322 RepID=A0A1M7DLJ8_9FIRM|nr:hypothetical protein SAMN02745136_05730 [Anaerocolumna jejuensis DSM 15929]
MRIWKVWSFKKKAQARTDQGYVVEIVSETHFGGNTQYVTVKYVKNSIEKSNNAIDKFLNTKSCEDMRLLIRRNKESYNIEITMDIDMYK